MNSENDVTKCPVCHTEFLLQGKLVGGLSEMIQNYKRIPYKCRKCGAPICKGCTENGQCPECGGVDFDVDHRRVVLT